MPKDETTASRQQTRAFLRAVYDGLGQPPLGAQLRATIIRTLDLLAEQDLERRFAVRARIAELLAEPDQQEPLPPAAPARGSGWGRWGAQGYIRRPPQNRASW